MEAVAQNFIKAFGWSILDSFWQCGIVYGILLITLISMPRLPAKTRHNLSYLSICTMFIWFCITFINKINFTTEAATTVSINDTVFQEYLLTHNSVNIASGAETYFPFIIIAYFIGMVLQMIIILKGYLIVKKLKRSEQQEVQDEWKIIFSKIVHTLNIPRKVSFKYSSIVKTPMVIGYLKPIILFPASLCTYLDAEQVEAILIHELSHIRRNDYLLNLIKTFIETVLFFNPFVWMAGRFILIEREHACDDMVLRFTNKPVSYAKALLQLELLTNKQTPAYAMAASGKPQFLFQRIKRITNMKTNYLNLKQQMAALTLAVACLISFAWIRPVANKKAKALAEEVAKEPIPFRPGVHNTKIQVVADTIKDPVQKKTKIKIVVTDDAGNKKEYNSLKELPDSLKDDSEIFGDPAFLFKNGDSVYFKKFNSKEWQNKQEELAKKFNSPEWKNQQKEMAKKYQELALNLEKKFNSPEWKKQQEQLEKKSRELALDLEKKFNSPEWKKQQEQIEKKSKELALDLEKKFNSPEWKKQQKEWAEKYKGLELNLEKKFNSPEWQEKLSSGEFNFKMDTLLNSLKSQNFDKFSIINDRLFSGENGLNHINLYLSDLQKDNELKDNDQYIRLKEKFDRDVEKLKKKEARKSKKRKEN